ncbi:MAG: glycosyltransferase family 9 protein [Deltaproteobacteria bacterium]|nr:glycosyltransferase family 9 protein [Deltaproteobacteria bacterium]
MGTKSKRRAEQRVQVGEESADRGLRRILLVSTTAVGDTLLSTPAIRAARENFPDAQLFLLCHERSFDLVKYNPHLQGIFLYRGKSKGNLRLVRKLKRYSFDASVILHGNDPEAVAICCFSRIPMIAGNAQSRLALALTHPIPKPSPHTHLIDHRISAVSALSPGSLKIKLYDMELYVGDEERRSISSWLGRKWKNQSGPIVALHPGGSIPTKHWRKERWALLADCLARDYGARLVFIGGIKEREMGESILAQCSGHPLNAIGEFKLLQTAALLERAALCITTDSGPMHIALAVKTPVIALFGPDRPQSSGPHPYTSVKNTVLESNPPCKATCDRRSCQDNICMAEISVAQVLASVSVFIRKC